MLDGKSVLSGSGKKSRLIGLKPAIARRVCVPCLSPAPRFELLALLLHVGGIVFGSHGNFFDRLEKRVPGFRQMVLYPRRRFGKYGALHNATARSGGWDVNLPVHQTCRITLKKTGQIDYYCRAHPNMTGKIEVSAK